MFRVKFANGFEIPITTVSESFESVEGSIGKQLVVMLSYNSAGINEPFKHTIQEVNEKIDNKEALKKITITNSSGEETATYSDLKNIYSIRNIQTGNGKFFELQLI